MSCLREADKVLNEFSALASKDAGEVIEKMMASLSEKNLETIIGILNSKANVDFRLKQFAHVLFGEPLMETKTLGEIATSVVETAELLVATSIESSRDATKPVTVGALLQIAKKYYNRRVGARESAVASETTMRD